MELSNAFFLNYKGFHHKTRAARLAQVAKDQGLSAEEQGVFSEGVRGNLQEEADYLIENTIGCFPLPLGVATNCVINGSIKTFLFNLKNY